MGRTPEEIIRTNLATKDFSQRTTYLQLKDELEKVYGEFAVYFFEVTQGALRRAEARNWEGMQKIRFRRERKAAVEEISAIAIPNTKTRLEYYDSLYYLGLDGKIYICDRHIGYYRWDVLSPKSAYKDERSSLKFSKDTVRAPQDFFSYERQIVDYCNLIYPVETVAAVVNKGALSQSKRRWWQPRPTVIKTTAAIIARAAEDELVLDTTQSRHYIIDNDHSVEWIDHVNRGDTITVTGRDMIVGIMTIEGDVFVDVQGEGSKVTFDPMCLQLVHFAPCFTADQYLPIEATRD